MPTQGFLHKYFPAGYEHEFEHLCETASEIMSKKEFVIYNLVMFSSLKSVVYYTKIMVITPGGPW